MPEPPGERAPNHASELFLLDTMGELTKAFSLADVAVVGRSFVAMGGSDPIEPIALGKATVMGPHYENFRGVVESFRSAEGIRISPEPWPAVTALLEDVSLRRKMGERGRRVIQERKGATEKNAHLLQRLLSRKEDGEFTPKASEGIVRRWLFRLFLAYMVLGYLTTLLDRIPESEAWDPETAAASASGAAEAPLPGAQGVFWSGAFSVHTDRSHDARGTREDVARAARKAGLDFVVIGDHPPDDRKPGWSFWEPVDLEGVLIEGGQELRSPEAGKILAVGVDTTYKRWEGDYGSFVDMLSREQATAFVVHGRGPRGSERWVNPDARGMQGWEVLDISEFASHRLKGPWSLYHLVTLLLGTPVGLGDEAMLHLMREGFRTPTVAAYDSLRMRERLTATAGLNTHPKVALGPLLIPAYGPFFRTLVTHVEVETSGAEGSTPGDMEPARASALLMAGARKGDVFISLGDEAAASSFRMGVEAPGGIILASMGGDDLFAPGVTLRAGFEASPGRKILYRVVRNGRGVAWVPGPDLDWTVQEPGVYRVELYTYWGRVGRTLFHLRPWIFGNPVALR
jgi:hypothetical protein